MVLILIKCYKRKFKILHWFELCGKFALISTIPNNNPENKRCVVVWCSSQCNRHQQERKQYIQLFTKDSEDDTLQWQCENSTQLPTSRQRRISTCFQTPGLPTDIELSRTCNWKKTLKREKSEDLRIIRNGKEIKDYCWISSCCSSTTCACTWVWR